MKKTCLTIAAFIVSISQAQQTHKMSLVNFPQSDQACIPYAILTENTFPPAPIKKLFISGIRFINEDKRSPKEIAQDFIETNCDIYERTVEKILAFKECRKYALNLGLGQKAYNAMSYEHNAYQEALNYIKAAKTLSEKEIRDNILKTLEYYAKRNIRVDLEDYVFILDVVHCKD